MDETRFFRKKYNVTDAELTGYTGEEALNADEQTEHWRDANGCPAASSALSRGYFLDTLEQYRIEREVKRILNDASPPMYGRNGKYT